MNKKRATTRLISSENEIESSVLKTGTEEEFNKAVIANTTPQSIYFRLWKAKQEIEAVKKNAKNPHFKSNYADINSILDAVEPVLLKYQLLLLQPIENGKVYSRIFDVETGEFIESSIELPQVNDPQRLAGAVTYFRRYTVQSLLSLSAEDDDANTVTQAIKQQKPSIDQARFEGAIKAIKDGSYTVDKLRNDFTLTELQEAALKLM